MEGIEGSDGSRVRNRKIWLRAGRFGHSRKWPGAVSGQPLVGILCFIRDEAEDP